MVFVKECLIAVILYMTAAATISISYVVSWVAPIPGMWCLDDLGRESWDRDGQESVLQHALYPPEKGEVARVLESGPCQGGNAVARG